MRLPVADSLAEVEMIRGLGVEIRVGVTVGKDIQPEELLRDHDALFLGIGLGRGARLGIPGEDLPGAYESLDVIAAAKLGNLGAIDLGDRVAVIGGGNTAIDAATVASRAGAKEVTVLYRRGEQEMPAYRYDLDFARLEGVSFQWLTAPVRVLGEERVSGLECVRTRLGSPDESGRRRPTPVPGSEFRMAVDTVIKALGQVPLGDPIARVEVIISPSIAGQVLAMFSGCRSRRPQGGPNHEDTKNTKVHEGLTWCPFVFIVSSW